MSIADGVGPFSWAWDCDTTVPSTDFTTQNATCNYAAAGTFTAKLTATNGLGSDFETHDITVTAAQPQIVLSTPTISRQADIGTDALASTFTVRNGNVGVLTYSVADAEAWLDCTPAGPSTSTGEADTIVCAYTTNALAAGNYTDTITVTCGGVGCSNSPQTIAVNLTMVDPSAAGAIACAAVGQKATSAGSFDWTAYPNFTIEGWVKLNNAADPQWKILLETVAGVATDTSGVAAQSSSVSLNTPTFLRLDSKILPQGPTNWSGNLYNWGHIAFTYDGISYRTYGNGVLLATATGSPPPALSNGVLQLCQSPIGGGSDSLRGMVSELRIWSTARTGPQIADHKDCRIDPNAAGLVDYYPFTEQSGTTATNAAAAATHGNMTLAGGASFTPAAAPSLTGTAGADCLGAPATPTVTLSTDLINVTTNQGSSPNNSSFTVANAGLGTLDYTVAENESWMTVYPTVGSSSGEADPFVVSYSTASLAAGTYSGTIVVTPAGGTPQSITVNLTVLPPPIITLDRYSIPFSVTVGGSVPSTTFTVRNAATTPAAQTLSYTITPNVPWAMVNPGTGTSTGDIDTITLTLDTTGLAIGVHGATVTVSDDGGVAADAVLAILVTVNPAPLATIGRAPSAIDVAITTGATTPPSSLTIRNTGEGTLTWAITTNQAWCTVAPTSGSTTTEVDTITLNLATAGLPAGANVCTVTITAGSPVSNSPQTTTVTVTATDPVPTLDVAPLFIAASTATGNVADSQNYVISNPVAGTTLTWSVASLGGAPWLQCGTANGTTTLGAPDTNTASFTGSDALAAGTYTETCRVTGAAPVTGSPKDVAVTLVVADAQPPTIATSVPILTASATTGTEVSPLTFDLENIGGTDLVYSVVDGRLWVQVDPPGGVLAPTDTQQITVRFATSDQLGSNIYNTAIAIVDPNATNNPVVLPLVVTISGPAVSPQMVVTQTSLIPTAQRGRDALSDTFSVVNEGGGTLNYSIAVSGGTCGSESWLSITPGSGTSTGEFDPITVNYFNSSRCRPGTYTGSINLTGDGSITSISIPVTLTILSPPFKAPRNKPGGSGGGKRGIGPGSQESR